jgi:hypothetical protein
MPLVLKDRVQETTTTTGTGTLTLAGAVSGFQSFSVIGNGNTCYYAIVGGTEWEVGVGTYTSSGTTLSRDTILESSNGGTAVDFSAGTKNVFVTYPAEQGIYKDASGNAIALGTPASATLTNATGLPISTGVSGLGTNVATFLATPSSANLASAVTDETGSGSLVFATSPTLVTPVLGTPSSGTLTSCTGYTYANLSGTVPTWNQNTTGTAAGLSATLVETSGGTGQSTYAVGDLLQGGATNTLNKLTAVATGNALISGGITTASSWGKIGLTTHVSGTLPIANGGTNLTTYTTGDIIYASATNTLARLADVATGNALISGGVGVAPSYGKIGLTTHVTGTLPVANGGTGVTSLTSGRIPYGSGTGAFGSSADLSWDNSNSRLGVGNASPTYKVDITATNASALRVQPNTGTNGTTIAVSNNGGSLVLSVDSSTGSFYGTNYAATLMHSGAYPMVFGTNNTEKMRIDSSGNVGIGTTSPQSKTSFAAASANYLTFQNSAGSSIYAAIGVDSGAPELVVGASANDTVIRTNQQLWFALSGGQAVGRFDSSANFRFNSGYGSVATAYGCRAWVNFNGTAASNLSGTYARTSPSTTLTVTATAHGLIVGNSVFLDFTSGTGLDGIYTVVTVADANTFTVTTVASTTTSGNVNLLRNTIRGSGNVSSITDNATGDYTVNFATAMPDTNYCFTGTAGDVSGSGSRTLRPYTYETNSVSFNSTLNSGASDPINANVAIFR